MADTWTRATPGDLDDDTEPYMTVARMEQIMTPRMAAHVLARTAMFRLAAGRDDGYTDRLDKLLAEDGHHLAFVYAVHAVARRA